MPAPTTDLFSPVLQTGHPLTITAVRDFADANPDSYIADVGGIETQLLTNEYSISWNAVKHAVFYRLYGSVSSERQSNLLQDNLTSTSTTFVPPVFTEVIEYYFWVSSVDATGKETYLTNDPANLETTKQTAAFAPNPITGSCNFMPDPCLMNKEIKKAYEYIRFGNRFQLENGGEPAWLYLRRHATDKPFGVACTCNNSLEAETDPDYQGRGRCSMCFGTGIYGGYYPPIPIRIRYSNAPAKRYIYGPQGMILEHAFNTFMIWAPIVRSEDLVVRALDGSRYFVTSRGETSARGVRLHQEFDLEQIPITDIRMDVTPEKIDKIMKKAKMPKFAREGFKSFG